MQRQTPVDSSARAYTGGGCRICIDTVNDGPCMQETKDPTGMQGESWPSSEAPQNYGFTSVVMPADKDKDGNMTGCAEGFMSFMGGNRNFPVCGVMDDRRHRLKELEKGDSAMYRTKDDRQQFHLTKDGNYMSCRNDRTQRIALVPPPQQDQQQQQKPQATTTAAGGGGGSGGQQQMKKPTGQKDTLDDNRKSDTFIEQTKDHNHIRRGKGNVKTTDANTHTFHGDETKSTRCDDGHVHIRHGGMKIWVDPSGCHSTVPITICDCSDPSSGAGGLAQSTSAAESERYYIYPPAPAPVPPSLIERIEALERRVATLEQQVRRV